VKNRSIVVSAAIPTFVVAVVCAIAGYIAKGKPGLIGAIAGAAVVLIFFTIGQVVLGRVLRTNPTMAMTVAMTMYLVKIGALFALLLAFQDTTLFDTKIFAASVLAATLTWTIAEVWAFATSKVLYVDPSDQPPFSA
jgi:ATP synthase protein I